MGINLVEEKMDDLDYLFTLKISLKCFDDAAARHQFQSMLKEILPLIPYQNTIKLQRIYPNKQPETVEL